MTHSDKLVYALHKRAGWGETGLDLAQAGLAGLGFVPVVGNIADAANTAVSLGRGLYTGDKGYYVDAGLNALAALPGAGLVLGGAGAANKTKNLLRGSNKLWKAVNLAGAGAGAYHHGTGGFKGLFDDSQTQLQSQPQATFNPSDLMTYMGSYRIPQYTPAYGAASMGYQ